MFARYKIGNEDASRIIETKALLDMGATLTAIPRQITSHLGLKPRGMSWVGTGAGIMEVERPRAYIEIVGKSKVVPVLVSDTMDKVLIGLTTLEVLELEVDPVTGKLKERALLLYLD
jgi:predicted aspartyl protease